MRPSEKSARRQPLPESGIAQSTAENLLGDFSALLQQIGAAEMWLACESAVHPVAGQISSVAGLRRFLETYLSEILLPLELPAIARACGQVRRGELRELIALDQKIASEPRLAPFASASRTIGSMQLQRLRPLRDERTVQRYLSAVKDGQAQGWHTLVYGLTLAVYSIPLRQGLLHYARETISGLAHAAGGSAHLFNPAGQEMLETIFSRLPDGVEEAVPACEL
ncbi:MAG TPA: urease accessory UreF family protein [Candidatus Saccharimonadales bacterium]|nr:urease accessory UreF family protein [Candidatus Saccharimonadales bacterium]